MTTTDIASARQWIARLKGELAELGVDNDLRDIDKRRVADGILEEIARVERLIQRESNSSGMVLSP